jgi:hypothetical protein
MVTTQRVEALSECRSPLQGSRVDGQGRVEARVSGVSGVMAPNERRRAATRGH